MSLLPVILPDGFRPKVSVNDKLTAGQIIAAKKGKFLEEEVSISSQLKTEPQKAFKNMKKNLGDAVAIGETIAVGKKLLGIRRHKVVSEFSGTIARIDEEKGNIYIRKDGEEDDFETILSPVEGTVEICNNDKIVIKTDKEAVIAEETAGQSLKGELFLIEGEVSFNKITQEASKKIILGKELEKGAVFKAFGIGAIGAIAQDIEDSDFEDINEKNIKGPVFKVTAENYKKLTRFNGREVYLDCENKAIIIL